MWPKAGTLARIGYKWHELLYRPGANNESSEVIDILLPVTFYFNPSTRLDNVKNLWRFVIILPGLDKPVNFSVNECNHLRQITLLQLPM